MLLGINFFTTDMTARDLKLSALTARLFETPTTMSEICRFFPQSLQENVVIVP
jgi:hypothetical protein